MLCRDPAFKPARDQDLKPIIPQVVGGGVFWSLKPSPEQIAATASSISRESTRGVWYALRAAGVCRFSLRVDSAMGSGEKFIEVSKYT